MERYEALSLLFLGGIFLVALLAYIDRENKRIKFTEDCTTMNNYVMIHTSQH